LLRLYFSGNTIIINVSNTQIPKNVKLENCINISINLHLIIPKTSLIELKLYLHVNVVYGVSDVLEDRLERHEEIPVLESVIDTAKNPDVNLKVTRVK
jgi:hypothetical protein